MTITTPQRDASRNGRRHRSTVLALVAICAFAAACVPPTEPDPQPAWVPFTAEEYPNVLSGWHPDYGGNALVLVADDGTTLDPTLQMGATPASEQVTWLDDHHLFYFGEHGGQGAWWVLDTLTGERRATGGALGILPRTSDDGRVVATAWSESNPAGGHPLSAGVAACVFTADFADETCTYTPLDSARPTAGMAGQFLGPWILVTAVGPGGTHVDGTIVTGEWGEQSHVRYPIDRATAVVTDAPASVFTAGGSRAWDADDERLVTNGADELVVIDASGGSQTVHTWSGDPAVPFDASSALLTRRGGGGTPPVMFTSRSCVLWDIDCPVTLRRWDPDSGQITEVATVDAIVKDYTRYRG